MLLWLELSVRQIGLRRGAATGQLVVGGRQTALAHAHARAQPDTFDKTKGKAHVVSVELTARADHG